MDMGSWLRQWKDAVLGEFGEEKVCFMGIQGSRAREEARPDSDIDVVLILEELDLVDLERYRSCVARLPEREKLCGFISGRAELEAWPRSELFQFCLDTKAVYGSLDSYAKSVTREDVLEGALTGAGGVYHACVHNYLHERSEAMLYELCKSAFFTLRAVHFLETGRAVCTRERLKAERGTDADIIDSKLSGSFEEQSRRLLRWSSEILKTLGQMR